ncbi:MAG: carbohydrate binding family 9 domain-containing protein [Terracidiphilus sp.]
MSLLFCGASLVGAQSKQTASTASPATAPPTIASVPTIDQPLKLDDFAGMVPRPELRDKLAHVTGFIQQLPSDGNPATEATEVWMAYSRTTLYFVFLCHDSHPDQVRTHLARRENVQTDDNVLVLLDPFQDHRTGVMFQVNASGVQADASWNETTGPDYSYDQVWDSEGRVTKEGWMALIAIPFRSLRFHVDHKDWGVVFERNLPRNSEQDYWPRVGANVSGVLTQEATLRGIEGVTGSHNFQLNPYALGQNERKLIDLDPTNPYFSSRHMEGTAGGEVKLVLKDSIVLDGTINPDFSDIESDQPQFTVDQRFPVYFPELRPFFLENASYFNTPITLVYTRNIAHPEYGLRMTGKLGRTNLGVFAIDDRQPGESVATTDPLYGKHATVAVGRVSRDIGEGSGLGAIYTDEEFGGGWNRIGGADFTARFDKHWTAHGQMVESSTIGDLDSGLPAPYSAGPASDLQVSRNGHAFNMFNEYQDVSTGFQTSLGFLQSSNIRSDHLHSNYQWFPKKSVVQSWGLEENQNLAFDHQGDRVYHYTTLDPFWLLPRNFVLAPLIGQNSDTVSPANYPALTAFKNFTENFGGFVVRGAPWSQFNLSLVAIRGGNVNYNPLAGQSPFLLNQDLVNLLFTVQPVNQLTIDNTYLLDRDHAVAGGAFVYESQTMRTKVNYQFTRSISARVIAEYDSTLANPLNTSLLRTREVATQALLTWLPHPGTAVYLGYNDDLQNLNRSLCNRLPNGACDPNNTTFPRAGPLLNDGRQIFVKASYLFRF